MASDGGVIGGRGVQPQSNSHDPSRTKQAPCPQTTSHILVVFCSSPQDTGGTFPTSPFPLGCQGCQWDMISVPERRTPRRGWQWGHYGSGVGWVQALPFSCLLLDIKVLTSRRVGLGNPWGFSPQSAWKSGDSKQGEVGEGVLTTHHPVRAEERRG